MWTTVQGVQEKPCTSHQIIFRAMVTWGSWQGGKDKQCNKVEEVARQESVALLLVACKVRIKLTAQECRSTKHWTNTFLLLQKITEKKVTLAKFWISSSHLVSFYEFKCIHWVKKLPFQLHGLGFFFFLKALELYTFKNIDFPEKNPLSVYEASTFYLCCFCFIDMHSFAACSGCQREANSCAPCTWDADIAQSAYAYKVSPQNCSAHSCISQDVCVIFRH